MTGHDVYTPRDGEHHLIKHIRIDSAAGASGKIHGGSGGSRTRLALLMGDRWFRTHCLEKPPATVGRQASAPSDRPG